MPEHCWKNNNCEYFETTMKKDYLLKEYYINYLRNVRKLSESSVKHYLGGLSTISKVLKTKEIIEESIYEVNTLVELLNAKAFLLNDPDFLIKDSVGHNMYSAALNNYIRFAEGDDFFTAEYSVEDIDVPVKVAETKLIDSYQYKRSSIIKNHVIKAAHFMCECDSEHITFTAKRNNKQYMEGHHLIPMKAQIEFKYSLDTYANIVSLCPNCHRLLHYGIETEKKSMLEELYKQRYARLHNSGIEISKNDFLELTL